MERPGSGIDLRALSAAEREEGLAFFFGGVDDTRHVFATLRDIQLQCIGLRAALGAHTNMEEAKANAKLPPCSPPRVSIVVNDIKEHAFAQFVVMLQAVVELAEAMEAKGCPTDSMKALSKTKDPVLLKLGGRVVSLSGAPLLLPDDAAWIKALMERAVALDGPQEVHVIEMIVGLGDDLIRL